MREVEYIYKIAQSSPDKIALITENNQLNYRDFVGMLVILENQLAAAGVTSNSVVVANTNRAELEILLNVLPSYVGFHIIHSDVNAVVEAGIDFDFYVGLFPVDTVPANKTILVRGEWFADISPTELPELKEIAPEYISNNSDLCKHDKANDVKEPSKSNLKVLHS